jgi:hypothetical protein
VAFPRRHGIPVCSSSAWCAGSFLDDHAPEAPEAADDDVTLERIDAALHGSPLEDLAKAPLEHELGDHREHVERGPHADHDQRDGVPAPGLRERPDLAVADRGQRGHGHEQGVGEAPALDEHVAEGAEHVHAGEDGERDEEPAQRARPLRWNARAR